MLADENSPKNLCVVFLWLACLRLSDISDFRNFVFFMNGSVLTRIVGSNVQNPLTIAMKLIGS